MPGGGKRNRTGRVQGGSITSCSILINFVVMTTAVIEKETGITRIQTRTCSCRIVPFMLNGTSDGQKWRTVA
ncbi:MAG TPA: hypothetical protein VGK23_01570 [Methanomassiliicoccales archaeon]